MKMVMRPNRPWSPNALPSTSASWRCSRIRTRSPSAKHALRTSRWMSMASSTVFRAGMGSGGGVNAVADPLPAAARPNSPTDTRKMVIVTARMATRRFCLRMRLGGHLMADVPGEREDRIAGVHAQRRGQDGRVGDVQPVHVPGAAERIHDVAPGASSQGTASHGMAARDGNALLPYETEGENRVDLLGRVHDERLRAVEENAPGPRRKHDAGAGLESIEPMWLVRLGQFVHESAGGDAPDRLIAEHEGQGHGLVEALHERLVALG